VRNAFAVDDSALIPGLAINAVTAIKGSDAQSCKFQRFLLLEYST